ncbi:MAG TPA: SDR family NAD(P)-dependent oxidoreductase, partial [Solirubrobacteraceae bacterium]|nr:SDR family NAD(P)-dependent oxidoreductase [Solirubrobacteraceae bacterium]
MGIYSRIEGAGGGELAPGEGGWTRHASGVLAAEEGADRVALRERVAPLEGAWPPQDAVAVAVEGFYEQMAERGLDYGPAFLGIQALWRRGEELFAELSLADAERAQAGLFGIHPALLDAGVQAFGASPAEGEGGGEAKGEDGGLLRLPFAFNGVELYAEGAGAVRAHISPAGAGGMSFVAVDESGAPVASMKSLMVRGVAREQLTNVRGSGDRDALFVLDWEPASTSAPTNAAPTRAVPTDAAPTPPEPVAGDTAVVVGARGSALAQALVAAGRTVELHESLGALGEALGDGGTAPGVVFVDCGLGEARNGTVQRVLGLAQKWLADERFAGSRLALITWGAMVARPGDGVPDLAGAPVWGLVRSAQSENPGRFVLVDVEDSHSLDALERALDTGEPQLAIRVGAVLVPRLTRGPAPASGAPPAPPSGGTVLVTGGTGAVGGVAARHLVREHGVGRLLLVSRSGSTAEGAPELQAELEALGAHVQIAQCDVSDREAVRALLDSIPREAPLRGVVHAAGLLDDGVMESLTDERLERVLAAKAHAAWHLHELTADLDLGLFVLFSSAAGTLGSPGQGNYAAANAFLDGLAAHRRARGLAGVSIAWGAWEQSGGMAARLSEADRARVRRSGLGVLSAERAMGLFDRAVAGAEAFVFCAPLDLGVLRAQARMGALPTLLGGLVAAPARRPGAQGGSLARRLTGVAEDQRERVALEAVVGQVAAVLGHPATSGVDARRTFKDAGFDSLSAVELRNRLGAVTGLRLPATLVFDYPTPVAVAKYLLAEIAGGEVGAATPRAPRAAVDEPLAIVGMSCRYPGGVRSAEELWQLVSQGRDGISLFPVDRGWDLAGLYDPDPDRPGTCYTREGGFLLDAGEFDAGFFGIGPREALAMDPQQRLLLEAAWEAMEDAGIDPASLRGSQTGVFAGISSSDYGLGLGKAVSGGLEGYRLTGGTGSVASGRVAYTFGFEGPAVSVDTACSSSLVALHWACQALRQGECELALAGGVTVLASPGLFVEFARQRGLSPDGRCKSFADAADGVGWGEGVGLVLLERLSDAQRNGHRVLGVVRASAVNQDGASNGLTAPNGPSQRRVIERALAGAGLSPVQVDAVEAHGTGTTLGDPIEAQALLATYGQGRPEGRPLWLGSVKSNIGHTGTAAGVAGVIKMVQALRHGVLPRTLHVDEPSTQVDWSAGAVALLTEQVPWERGGEPRRAGVSSFGISGTNAHVILEEAPVAESERSPAAGAGALGDRVVPWVLSGRAAGALSGQAGRLREFVEGAPELDLSSVGRALLGRSVFEQRAVVVGEEREALLAGLGALTEGGAAGESAAGVVHGAPGVSVAGVVRGVAAASDGVVFVFPGQGAQWVGMGRELLECSGVFARRLGECGEALAPFVEFSVVDVLREGEALERVDVVQPVLWAVMVSLAELWRACGVRPDVVVGHSQGEIAAACVAGGLSLQDAARVVALRSRALLGLVGRGGMVSVGAGVNVVEDLLAGFAGRAGVAAVNGPGSVVVSGDVDALGELVGVCEARGVWAREIAVDYASHSAH